MTKPKPKVVSEVCTLCGLDWKLHGTEPTAETCVKLLLDEVRSLNSQLAHRPLFRPYPYTIPVGIPQPYPVPYHPHPHWPVWYRTTSGGSTASMPTGPQRLSITSVAANTLTPR